MPGLSKGQQGAMSCLQLWGSVIILCHQPIRIGLPKRLVANRHRLHKASVEKRAHSDEITHTDRWDGCPGNLTVIVWLSHHGPLRHLCIFMPYSLNWNCNFQKATDGHEHEMVANEAWCENSFDPNACSSCPCSVTATGLNKLEEY